MVKGPIIIPSKSTTGTVLSPWAIRKVRELTRWIKPNHNYPRIYLKRSGSVLRKIVNETELEDYLSLHGFVSIDPALLSVEEQISIFKGTNFLISAHGSALANIAFCSPGTSMIEIFGPSCGETCYPRMAQFLKLKHVGVQASVLSYLNIMDRARHYLDLSSAPFHFKVDIAVIEDAIAAIER